MTALRRQDGQVTVLAAVLMVALVGMAALVVDVGSWFQTQRATQSTVDAAALAGAQALPGDPGLARALAKSYGAKNGGSGEIADSDITFASTYQPFDTIRVRKAKPVGGFFGSVLGISTVTVHAHASAMVGVPPAALYVAPIVVNILHPDLVGSACGQAPVPPATTNPCYGPSNVTTLARPPGRQLATIATVNGSPFQTSLDTAGLTDGSYDLRVVTSDVAHGQVTVGERRRIARRAAAFDVQVREGARTRSTTVLADLEHVARSRWRRRVVTGVRHPGVTAVVGIDVDRAREPCR